MSVVEVKKRSLAPICVGVGAAGENARRQLAAILGADALEVKCVRSPEELLEEPALDIAVVATNPSARHGEEVVRMLAAQSGLPVVAVVPDDDRKAQRAALRVGAVGLVNASACDRALAPTVRAVLAGQMAVPPELRSHFDKPALSYREKQVLGLVVMGYTNGEIARTLFLAESTIKSHLSSSFQKLGVRSRNEAAKLIVDGDNGLGAGILTIADGQRVGSRVRA